MTIAVTFSRLPLLHFLQLLLVLLGIAMTVDIAHAERLPVRTYGTVDGLVSDYVIGIYRDSRGFLWFSTREGVSRFDGLRFTSYGLADGLPVAVVNRVLEARDRTYWIGTNGGGLCRFNPAGARPAESAGGSTGALPASARRARAEPLFACVRIGDEPATNRIDVLYEDRAGRLWIGTDDGLFRLDPGVDPAKAQRVELPRMPADPGRHGITSLVEDADGSLWIGGGFGLARRLPGGRMIAYELASGRPPEGVRHLAVAHARQVWVGWDGSGVMILEADKASSVPADGDTAIVRMLQPPTIAAPTTTAPTTIAPPKAAPLLVARQTTKRAARETTKPDGGEPSRWYTTFHGLPSDRITAIHVDADQHLWVGTFDGLSEFDGDRFRAYSTANGLTDNTVTAITEDATGNLWIGSVAGVARLIRHGLVTYDQRDGLGSASMHALGEDASGRLLAISGDYLINRFDGRRFVAVRPDLPRGATCRWMSHCGYLDRAGDWWMLTSGGLFQVSDDPRRATRARHRTLRADDPVTQVFEDSRGSVWIGTAGGAIVEWRRPTGTEREFSEADGLRRPGTRRNAASAFAEDRGGALWIGFYEGGLARWRDGVFDIFAVNEQDGVPAGLITALHVDKKGRLWIGTNVAGLARVDDPGVTRPSFQTIAGTTSRNIRCLTEDAAGRIYAGTSRGIDRIDPANGRVTHFSAGEGLASEFVNTAFRDRHGMLWFGTVSGLSRLDPSRDTAREPAPGAPAASQPATGTSQPTTSLTATEAPLPSTGAPLAATATGPSASRVWISGLRVRGVPQIVSELGEPSPAPLTLSPDQNQLEIDFFGISFATGEPLRYQYRLDGIDTDWSPPSALRSVSYARLSPGSYRFLVRSAAAADGLAIASQTPAIVEFTVQWPFYLRWWFVATVLSLTGAIGYAVHRARIAQVLRVERVRARIATDLHDDIGASLSQIAILAEVARQRRTAPVVAPDAAPGAARHAAPDAAPLGDPSRSEPNRADGVAPGDPSRSDPKRADGADPLERIAETSRTLVDAMSDIVWAVNPQADSLADLVHRMRRFAEDTLSAGDIECLFRAPEAGEAVKLGADVRREIYLLLKESVTNIAKHAACTRVEIDFASERHRLRLRVQDDGRGFDPSQRTDGNGVASMRRRVAALGGRLEIDSAPGRGTTILLDIDPRRLAGGVGGHLLPP